jgi:hypothetical protein
VSESSAEAVEQALVEAEGEKRLAAEIAYYHYLIGGIQRGVLARARNRNDPIEEDVAKTTLELLDDLMAKVYKAMEKEGDG